MYHVVFETDSHVGGAVWGDIKGEIDVRVPASSADEAVLRAMALLNAHTLRVGKVSKQIDYETYKGNLTLRDLEITIKC